ncbi:LOW QUALITY PROTEIN: dynein axonemal intermediate chain 4 [Discoglossus pictus]
MSTSRTSAKKPVHGPAITSKMGSRLKKASNLSHSGTQSKINYSLTNRSMLGSSSRKSISLYGDNKGIDKLSMLSGKQPVQVFDEQGNDVTPRPLFQLEPGAVPAKQNKLFTPPDGSGATVSDFFSISQQTGLNASFVGPFSRSTIGGSSSSKSSKDLDSFTDEFEEPISKREVTVSATDVPVKQEVVRVPTKEDLKKIIDIHLTDTETLWLLDIPPTVISSDAEEFETVKKRNEAYTKLCQNKFGNDRYTERMMQTFNGAPKSKEVQCERIDLQDAGVMASTWDLYDSFNSMEEPVPLVLVEKTSRSTSIASNSFSSSITETEKRALSQIRDDIEQDSEEVLQTEKFQQDLFFMERVVVENIFQPKLAAYRELPVLADPDVSVEIVKPVTVESKSPSLDRLWSFVCEMTKGHNVSSMAWNKKNPDLLAVGYGRFDFREDEKGGLACCWSLKNTMWPERVYHCSYSVTAVDFSEANPNLLAVGLYNGTIAIYNVQNKEDAPVLDSSDNPKGHAAPIWQLKWIMQDKPSLGEVKGEILVAISADGRITKWRIRTGLECNELMRIRRAEERPKNYNFEKEKRGEAYISRQAPGMCFDFLPKDSSIYLAGTEEGFIHKCSCSYNEQFLDTYRGHKGPVYKVAWSPFCSDVFLSCSGDWCVFLWRQDKFKPILSFSISTSEVHDIMWSPYSSLVFGAVHDDRVEIWDLGVNTIDPVAVSFANPGIKLSTILFAKNTNCVLVGDSDGQVSVYELRNMASPNLTEVDALYDIIKTILDSRM